MHPALNTLEHLLGLSGVDTLSDLPMSDALNDSSEPVEDVAHHVEPVAETAPPSPAVKPASTHTVKVAPIVQTPSPLSVVADHDLFADDNLTRPVNLLVTAEELADEASDTVVAYPQVNHDYVYAGPLAGLAAFAGSTALISVASLASGGLALVPH